jgi:NAD(P)-dependent dehydrogenase (short-subunit alcohol dehydrogenase family)
MAIIGLTRTLAAEVGRHMITVNAICPGGHPARDVELREAWQAFTGRDSAGTFDVSQKEEENRVLGGNWLVNEGYTLDFGGSDDVAAMAVFIASDEASHFTGQDVNTTGGYIMW